MLHCRTPMPLAIVLLAPVILALAGQSSARKETPETTKRSATADWWSVRPLTRPPVPQLGEADAAWVRNPIDAFILAKLREKGLAPSPQTDRRTLIRRLCFDLIGLPPTPEEMDAFLADTD